MNLTAEDVRRRIAQASGGLTAEQVRARIAQAPGAATPVPEVTNPTMEQVAASFSKPILETVLGVQELNLEGNPLRAGLERRMAGTQEALDWAEQNQAPGASGTGAGIAGELALMAVPASKMSKGARLLTKNRPFLGKVAPLTAEAGTVGFIEALKKPEEGELRAENALDAFTATMGVGAGQKLLSKMYSPQMFRRTEAAKEEIKALREAGIEPDIPITLGTKGRGPVSLPAAWTLRGPALGLPGTKGPLSKQIFKAAEDMRRLHATKAVPKGVQIPAPPYKEGSAPMEDTLRGIKKFYTDEYGEVLDPHTFSVIGGSQIGDRIAAAISKVPGAGSQKKVAKKVGELLQAEADASGVISGSGVSNLKTMLREEMLVASKKRPTMARGYQKVLDALDAGVMSDLGTMNPGHAKRYAALREPYAHYLVLKDAVGRAPKGEYQPKELRSAALRYARKRKMDELDAPYRAEAQRAEEVYDITPKTLDSNIFQLRALGKLALGGGAGVSASVLHPVGAALTGATVGTTALGIPRWGQKYMMGEARTQQALARLLRKPGMQELSRAARIGGGQYLAE